MPKRRVFISYSRSDIDFVTQLVSALKGKGVHIWYDSHIRIGTKWDSKIEQEIKVCDIMLIVLSRNSVVSNNVMDEMSYAIGMNKSISPIKIEDCDIPMRLARFQFIDFTQDFDAAVSKLLADINYEDSSAHEKATPGISEVPTPTPKDGKTILKGKRSTLIFSVAAILLSILVLYVLLDKDKGKTMEVTDPISIDHLEPNEMAWHKIVISNSVEAYISYLRENGNGAPYFNKAKAAIDSLLPYEGLVMYRNERGQIPFLKNLFFSETGLLETEQDVYRGPRKGDILSVAWDVALYDYVLTEKIEGAFIESGEKVKVVHMSPVRGSHVTFMYVKYGKLKD